MQSKILLFQRIGIPFLDREMVLLPVWRNTCQGQLRLRREVYLATFFSKQLARFAPFALALSAITSRGLSPASHSTESIEYVEFRSGNQLALKPLR